MVSNIEKVVLWKGSKNYNDIPIVKVRFKFPCVYTTFSINDLKDIMRAWIAGEESKYPPDKGFEGRYKLAEELAKVFQEKISMKDFEIEE